MTKPQSDTDDNDLDITDEEAEQLLADAVEADEQDTGTERTTESTDRDDSGLRDELSKWKSLARKHEKSFKDTSAKLKQYEDQGKSDLERLEERASTAESRAGTAESRAKALEIAMERAPEHATVAQIRAVAKRVRGDDEDALERDADELFELLAPESKAPKVAGSRPKERLKGGSEPDEEVEETDPRKLAAQLPRRR
jgi:hypothetical protein